MPAIRRPLAIALVVGVALGCSATSNPSTPSPSRSAPASATALATGLASPSGGTLPLHETLAGPDVAGAFDLATDGTVIAWSSGTVDVDAPALWSLDPASGARRLIYRSASPGAILSNLVVRRGTYAFAEVTPRADGSRTWRLVVVEGSGATHVLDVNDVPPAQTGVLPMAAISDRGILWAASHAGDATAPRCDLRYALLEDLRPRVVRGAPCTELELWYPHSDGRRFVYGTVEYGLSGAGDERYVYLVAEDSLGSPRRVDTDGQASLPAILDDTVVWKAAPTDLNLFSPAGLVELSLAPGSTARGVPFASSTPLQLTTPSLGPGYIVGEDAGGGSVVVWDRARSIAVDVDRLALTDAGFLSGTRLAGNLLAWFYTSQTQGGGRREIRWLALIPGHRGSLAGEEGFEPSIP